METQPGTVEPVEPLTCKTWTLKVSIHCQGCKSKVKKVLRSVEGVYTVNIEAKQQKVIVTGNVEAETLIKKLVKAGKHAELWPETAEEKKSRKSKKKEKQTDPETSSQEDGDGGSDTEKQAVRIEVVKFMDGGAKIGGGGGGGQAVDSKSDGKKADSGAPGDHSSSAEKKGGGGGEEKSGTSGSGGKKKKKKGHLSVTVSEPSSGGAPASTGSAVYYAGPAPPSLSSPRHHGYQYPPDYYAPPPVYVVSYSAAHPATSYTTSCYASPLGHSYAYTHPGPETEIPPSDSEFHPRQPLDSFELFSEENPNGCFII